MCLSDQEMQPPKEDQLVLFRKRSKQIERERKRKRKRKKFERRKSKEEREREREREPWVRPASGNGLTHTPPWWINRDKQLFDPSLAYKNNKEEVEQINQKQKQNTPLRLEDEVFDPSFQQKSYRLAITVECV